MSKTLARLEASRGVRLLHRSTHALSLTPEGERLVDAAREALQAFERADGALGAGGFGGRVRVGAPTAVLRACLAPLLPRFRTEHPDVLLDLRGSDRMIDLAEEAVDLVQRTGPLDGIPGHRRQRLSTFAWVACAAPGYVARHGEPAEPSDLAHHDLVGFRNQRTGLVDAWRFVDGRGERLRWVPEPAVVLDDASAAVAVATAGVGIAWAPHWLVADVLRDGGLVPVLSRWAGERMAMSVVRRDHDHALERVRRVIAFLRANRAAFA